jgi:hypothetical protein
MWNKTLPVKSVCVLQENEFLSIFAIESYKNTCTIFATSLCLPVRLPTFNLRTAEGVLLHFILGGGGINKYQTSIMGTLDEGLHAFLLAKVTGWGILKLPWLP